MYYATKSPAHQAGSRTSRAARSLCFTSANPPEHPVRLGASFTTQDLSATIKRLTLSLASPNSIMHFGL